jgi:hypothetical protein
VKNSLRGTLSIRHDHSLGRARASISGEQMNQFLPLNVWLRKITIQGSLIEMKQVSLPLVLVAGSYVGCVHWTPPFLVDLVYHILFSGCFLSCSHKGCKKSFKCTTVIVWSCHRKFCGISFWTDTSTIIFFFNLRRRSFVDG